MAVTRRQDGDVSFFWGREVSIWSVYFNLICSWSLTSFVCPTVFVTPYQLCNSHRYVICCDICTQVWGLGICVVVEVPTRILFTWVGVNGVSLTSIIPIIVKYSMWFDVVVMSDDIIVYHPHSLWLILLVDVPSYINRIPLSYRSLFKLVRLIRNRYTPDMIWFIINQSLFYKVD